MNFLPLFQTIFFYFIKKLTFLVKYQITITEKIKMLYNHSPEVK